jgi:hypothetical protein
VITLKSTIRRDRRRRTKITPNLTVKRGPRRHLHRTAAAKPTAAVATAVAATGAVAVAILMALRRHHLQLQIKV